MGELLVSGRVQENPGGGSGICSNIRMVVLYSHEGFPMGLAYFPSHGPGGFLWDQCRKIYRSSHGSYGISSIQVLSNNLGWETSPRIPVASQDDYIF